MNRIIVASPVGALSVEEEDGAITRLGWGGAPSGVSGSSHNSALSAKTRATNRVSRVRISIVSTSSLVAGS